LAFTISMIEDARREAVDATAGGGKKLAPDEVSNICRDRQPYGPCNIEMYSSLPECRCARSIPRPFLEKDRQGRRL